MTVICEDSHHCLNKKCFHSVEHNVTIDCDVVCTNRYGIRNSKCEDYFIHQVREATDESDM